MKQLRREVDDCHSLISNITSKLDQQDDYIADGTYHYRCSTTPILYHLLSVLLFVVEMASPTYGDLIDLYTIATESDSVAETLANSFTCKYPHIPISRPSRR